jgi:hypothetical protein
VYDAVKQEMRSRQSCGIQEHSTYLEAPMKYKVYTTGPSENAVFAVQSIEVMVQAAINNGATLTGGVSVLYIPNVGFQAFQSVLFPDTKE